MTESLTKQPAHRFPLDTDGSMLPAPLMLRHLAAHAREEGLVIDRLPPGNGVIPALCRLAGVKVIRLKQKHLPSSFEWGLGRGKVQVGDPNSESGIGRRHQGHLPVEVYQGHRDTWSAALNRMVDLVRLTDAAAVLTGGSDSTEQWEAILAALAQVKVAAPSPLAGQDPDYVEGCMRVWNPLPFSRRATVLLPTDGGRPPWAVEDDLGRVHPLQVVEGPLRQQWLVELNLDALECRDLIPHEDPLVLCRWEATPKVLDNGRVRTEFDASGNIKLLCFEGRFIDLDGPLAQPLVNGHPLVGDTSIELVEAGPVRSRILAITDSPAGICRRTYTLYAQAAHLDIQVQFQGAVGRNFSLLHPLHERLGQLECAGDLLPWTVPVEPSVVQEISSRVSGLRWARVGEAGMQRSLGFIALRPFDVAVGENRVEILAEGQVSYSLIDGGNRPRADLARAAWSLAVPARYAAVAEPGPAPFRLVDAEHVLPLWIDHPTGWKARVLLLELEGHSCKPLIFIPKAQECALVSMDGQILAQLRKTKEGDAFELPLEGSDLVLIAWR